MPPWMHRAACAGKDPELFFPEKGISAQRAKAICDTCPVRVPCLQFAVENHVFGVWGGLSERERRRVRRAA